jgi:hypothetical protein
MTAQGAGKPAKTRGSRPLAGCSGVALAAALLLAMPREPAAAAGVEATRAPQYFPALERPPLDPPLLVSGDFGEYRPGHFHAGLDFSTGETSGRPVFASLTGAVVRVRASGVGYGRSIYLQADDGRILVYGHLDAFDEPLASYVGAVQDSTGEYEQDLWPAAARFRVSAGQRLGWSGRSGTDAPHLHFEIRRGDVAYNPLLAGVSVADTSAPVFRRLTLDPHFAGSFVAGRPLPRTVRCTGSDTVRVAGPVRVVAEVADARADGRLTMAPWRVTLDDGSQQVECRFDSVSWAGGMADVDFVYDRGRVAPDERHSVLLWVPAGFRPGGLQTSAPRGPAAGTLLLKDPSRPLRVSLRAYDIAGHEAAETLVLEPGPAGTEPARPRPAAAAAPARRSAGGVRGFRWEAGPGTWFEASPVVTAAGARPPVAGELRPRSRTYTIEPALTPLRRTIRVRVAARAGDRAPAVSLYRATAEGWEWLGADHGVTSGWIGAETRRLGRFALFRDVEAPRIALLEPPRAVPAGPYPRWALEADLAEEGSGVDARASFFLVDGRRVPSEWDAVAGTLRWRPAHAPAGGRHDVEVVASDRAGNSRRRRGSFVLD